MTDHLSTLPRVHINFLPTPVVELKRLAAVLGGPRILMKRDDLTGLALGGNKTRKLEFLLGEALGQTCDTVITGGAMQSNHCRQTAAAAAAVGLECHLALGGEPQTLCHPFRRIKCYGRPWLCGGSRRIERAVVGAQQQG